MTPEPRSGHPDAAKPRPRAGQAAVTPAPSRAPSAGEDDLFRDPFADFVPSSR